MADDPTESQEARVIILRRMVVCRDSMCFPVCVFACALELTAVACSE